MTEENDKDKKIKGIEVSIDTKRTEELARENERLKMEKEDPERFQRHFDLADQKLQFYKDTGDHRYLDCKTKEEMKELTTALMKETVERRRGTPAGVSQLNDAQMGIRDDLYTHRFSGYDELISTLREKARNGSREAQDYLDTYTEQAWRKMKNADAPIPFPNRNDPENLPALKDFHGYKVCVRKEEGDLGALIERWANENPRRKKAKEQMERGANPQGSES